MDPEVAVETYQLCHGEVSSAELPAVSGESKSDVPCMCFLAIAGPKEKQASAVYS